MAFDVTLEGFSGPLDLLCSLVESRTISASRVRVSEVVRLYGSYLARGDVFTIREMAEFFALAARLLLGKIQAIVPGAFSEEPLCPEEKDDALLAEDDGDVEAALERYRPFRAGARVLEECFRRRSAYIGRASEEGDPAFELGDLYSLALLWWTLEGRRRTGAEDVLEDPWDDEGIPALVPEESQVESRMAHLRTLLDGGGVWPLEALLETSCGRASLVLTLLALLELCRLGEIHMIQERCFGNIRIALHGTGIPEEGTGA